MSVSVPARDLNSGDYVRPPWCVGWHRVTGVVSVSPIPGTVCVNVSSPARPYEGTWLVAPDRSVDVTFSGVELCTLDHNATRKLLP